MIEVISEQLKIAFLVFFFLPGLVLSQVLVAYFFGIINFPFACIIVAKKYKISGRAIHEFVGSVGWYSLDEAAIRLRKRQSVIPRLLCLFIFLSPYLAYVGMCSVALIMTVIALQVDAALLVLLISLPHYAAIYFTTKTVRRLWVIENRHNHSTAGASN